MYSSHLTGSNRCLALQKILVLTTTYPQSKHDTQPRFVEYLCHQLSAKYQVDVLAPAILGNSSDEGASNPRVTRYRYFLSRYESLCGGNGVLENIKERKLRLALVPFLLFSLFIKTLSYVRTYRPEIIHAHWILPQGMVAALVCRLFRAPPQLVVTSHGGDLFALGSKFSRCLKRFVLNSASAVTVVSHAMKDYCIDELGVDGSKIKVIPMGVDLTRLFVPSSNKIPNRVVFVGRLAEKKGLDVLLRALASAKDKVDISVVLVGGGASFSYYESLATRLGLEDVVIFTGAIPNPEVVKHLQVASVAVFPFVVADNGDQEGLGLTMVEAMGCGCLTIASDLPAIRDVIDDGVSGLIFPAGDSEKLAELLVQVLAAPENYIDIPVKGRESVLSKFDWVEIGNAYSHLFDGLLLKECARD